MTFKESVQLRKDWKALGNPPCDHSSTEREYINGAHSDFVCTTCGDARFTKEAFKTNK